MPIHLEIWSDIACPWCYVGKRRLERALEGFEHRDEVEVIWRAFQLDPDAPRSRPEGYAELLARKYGVSEQEGRAMLEQMTAMGAAEGIEMRFDLVRPANTFDGHRVVHLAATLDSQAEMEERLMCAYLGEGELISDHGTLRRLAVEVGLPGDRVDEVLTGDEFSDRVAAERELASGFGIRGVPFFAVERRLGATGAQSVETMATLLEESWQRFGPQAA